MRIIENRRGITLIALIVTIIVLIILAGVAINMLSGQNGVINRATEARYSNSIAGFDERTKLAYIAVRSKIEADKVSQNEYIATKADIFKKIVEEVEKEFNVTAVEGKANAEAGTPTKTSTEGYTITYYLDVTGNDKTDGSGYIAIWYTDNSLRSSLNRDEAISKHGLKDITDNKSVNQATLVRVIHVENYNSELSEKGLTSTTDSDNDVKEKGFGATTLNGKLGFSSNVTDPTAVPVESVTLTTTSAELKIIDGEAMPTTTISATILPAEAAERAVTYTSSKPEVATVDSTGKVTAVAVGKTTITGTVGGKSGTVEITVKQQVSRTGINVGDYISYTPPTKSAYTGFTQAATGYGSEDQTLPQEYTGAKWKVMKKYDDGSLDIVAAVTSSNQTIGFQDAIGYNNAIFLLDDACKYLYANESKGITARSIDYEDITSELVQNTDRKGQKKIQAYISSQVRNITVGSWNVIAKNGNKITYKISTWYPLLYKKQANESAPYYSAVTTETRYQDEYLTVEYTFYSGTMAQNDFADYAGYISNFYKAVFQTNSSYWLASHYVSCNSANADFGLRFIVMADIGGVNLFYSNDVDANSKNHVCPVVHIGSEVRVTVGSNPRNTSGAHTVVVPE